MIQVAVSLHGDDPPRGSLTDVCNPRWRVEVWCLWLAVRQAPVRSEVDPDHRVVRVDLCAIPRAEQVTARTHHRARAVEAACWVAQPAQHRDGSRLPTERLEAIGRIARTEA
eukprot:scaffold74075_cov31-Tisochrysis_lutea.AAC.1